MSTVVEITKLEHVILYHFQKMMQAYRPPEMAFSRLWYLCSNAACRMSEQGIHNPVSEKKEFSRQFFEAINKMCIEGTCEKKEEVNDGGRRQLISLSLTPAGREKVHGAIYAFQERAREPEIIRNPKPRYRGPII